MLSTRRGQPLSLSAPVPQPLKEPTAGEQTARSDKSQLRYADGDEPRHAGDRDVEKDREADRPTKQQSENHQQLTDASHQGAVSLCGESGYAAAAVASDATDSI